MFRMHLIKDSVYMEFRFCITLVNDNQRTIGPLNVLLISEPIISTKPG